jgi:hypothetical protein
MKIKEKRKGLMAAVLCLMTQVVVGLVHFIYLQWELFKFVKTEMLTDDCTHIYDNIAVL